MSAAPTRAYVIEDRNGEALALVRDCQNPSQAIRALLERTGLRARVATAEDALDAIADGVVPFSADDPTAGVAPGQDAKIAAIAADVRSLDVVSVTTIDAPLEEGRSAFTRGGEPTQAGLEAPDPFLVPRDSEGTPIPTPGEDPFLLPAHDAPAPSSEELEAMHAAQADEHAARREPTQAELEAADFAHDAAREARVFGGR